MSIPFGIIDIHVHIQPWWQLKPEIQAAMAGKRENIQEFIGIMTEPKKLLAIMDREGIEKLGMINYVSPEVMGFTDEVNDFVSKYQSEDPKRLLAFGSVHPKFCKDVPGEMDRLVEKLKIRAIKIHPPHQLFYPNDYRNGLAGLEQLYRKAHEHYLPVMIHTGTSNFPNARSKYGDPIHVDDVALDFPGLKIILAHGGRPVWMSTAFFLVRRHANVYLDISSIPPRSVMEYFPKLESIADKVLWGTDWPAPQTPSMGTNAEAFWNLPIPDPVKKKILRENAFQIFP